MKVVLFFLLLLLLPADASAAAEVSVEEGLTRVGNSYIAQELRYLKKRAPYDWLRRTDIGLRVQRDGEPVYSIETVQPSDTLPGRMTSLTQFRIGNDLGTGVIMNAGIGRRLLAADKASLYTVSAFYDYGVDCGHERIGGGIEYRRGRSSYRANVYHAISEPKETGAASAFYERALSGYDYSVGITFDQAPWAQFALAGFSWDKEDHDDMKVYAQLQITPRLNVEWGYLDNAGEHYGKLLYSLNRRGPAMVEKGKRVFRVEPEKSLAEASLFEKLPRQYRIEVGPVPAE